MLLLLVYNQIDELLLLLLQVMLGHYPFRRFLEQDVVTHIEELQTSLNQLSMEIDERNKTLEVPYVYFKREKVPNSITI